MQAVSECPVWEIGQRLGCADASLRLNHAATGRLIMSGKTRADNTPTLLTVTEAAVFLRTPAATLRYWRHLGVGPDSFRLGRRVMYRSEDLVRWIDEQRDADRGRHQMS